MSPVDLSLRKNYHLFLLCNVLIKILVGISVSRIIKERESRGIAKKNKEFLSLKRDIEQRAKQSKKNAKTDETNLGSYVDRDRAAATASIKDIKSELKVLTKQTM